MTNEEAFKQIQTIVAGDSEMQTMYNYFSNLKYDNSEILVKISLLNTLKLAMKDSVVQFVFKKKNGETRIAFGTRASDILSQNNSTPQGQRKCETTFPYYDIERKDWRCFKPELLESISTNYIL